MKKYFISTIVVLFFVGTNVYSGSALCNINSSGVQETEELLKDKVDDLTEFDILNGTSSSKPRRLSTIFNPFSGFFSETKLKFVILISDVFDVKVVNNFTGETEKEFTVNSTVNSESYVDITDLAQGDYTIYFYGRSAADKDDYYYGKFSVK